jgi:hypothetical protein
MMANMNDDEVAIIVNPTDNLRNRFENAKMRIELVIAKPFPGAFQQVQHEYTSFKEQVLIQNKGLFKTNYHFSNHFQLYLMTSKLLILTQRNALM